MVETIKVCFRCDVELEVEADEELSKEYKYFCPSCDENMFEFEVKNIGKKERS